MIINDIKDKNTHLYDRLRSITQNDERKLQEKDSDITTLGNKVTTSLKVLSSVTLRFRFHFN